MPSWSLFKIFATILWTLVAALLAFNVVIFFYWPLRWVVFVVSLTVGTVLLVSINWPPGGIRKKKKIAQLTAGELPLPSSLKTTEVAPSPPPPRVTSPESEQPIKLSPAEARRWLDDFLVKQQKK